MENLAAPETASNSAFTEFNVRQEEGKPHFVRLHDAVVKRLEADLEQRQSGLLLGSILPGEGCTIAVEEFEPAVRIEECVKTWQPQGGSRRQVVGFYRSHTRSGFALDAADRALFERCFPEGQRLILLVKPRQAEVGTAMFFLGEAGQLAADRATVEFPFNLRELGAEDTTAPIMALAKAVGPAVQPVVAKLPAPAPARAGVSWKIAIAGVVVIASGFGLSELKVFDRKTAQAQPVSAAVENPTPAAASQETHPPVREAESSAISKSAKVPLPSPQKTGTAPPAVTTGKVAVPPAPPKTAPQPPAPIAQPVLVTQRPAPAPTAPIQPAAEAPKPGPLPDPPQPIRKEAAPTPVAPPPAVERSPKTVEPSAPVVAQTPPITPPRAIQQVAPELPAKALKSMVGEVVVRLKVNVDASGRVISTEPVAGSAAIDPAVTSAVSSAVKRWKFEPARRGGEKVAGDVVLSFVFRK